MKMLKHRILNVLRETPKLESGEAMFKPTEFDP